MIKKIFILQTCVCILLLCGYASAGKLDSELIEERRSQAVAAMSKHYTVSDIWNKGRNAVLSFRKIPAAVSNYVMSSQSTQEYAQPVDQAVEGAVTSVYAVSGGQVIETGKNAELGNYIKIRHDEAVSVYGNCCRIYAKEGKHVRRGQVIGSYVQDKSNEFYYALIEE